MTSLKEIQEKIKNYLTEIPRHFLSDMGVEITSDFIKIAQKDNLTFFELDFAYLMTTQDTKKIVNTGKPVMSPVDYPKIAGSFKALMESSGFSQVELSKSVSTPFANGEMKTMAAGSLVNNSDTMQKLQGILLIMARKKIADALTPFSKDIVELATNFKQNIGLSLN